MPVWEVQGLTANDRSTEDKKQIQLQGSDFKESVNNADSLNMTEYNSGYTSDIIENAITEHEVNKNIYEEAKKAYTDYYKLDDEYADHRQVENYIKDIADKVSPHYRRFKNNEDYIKFNDKEWLDIFTEYNIIKNTQGENRANNWLQEYIKEHAAQNQKTLEKWVNGFIGLGAGTAGAIIQTAGTIIGGIRYLAGEGTEVEGLNGWQNFLNNAIDNEMTRYGQDVITTGYYSKDKIDIAKNYHGGIGSFPILSTNEQDNSIFNANTIPTALSQGGFTVATMITASAEAKLAGAIFKGLKGMTLASTVGNTTKRLSDVRKILQSLQKAEKATNAFLIPAISGTHEGFAEGLGTKLEVLENARSILAEEQNNKINKRTQELLSLYPGISEVEARRIAFDEYSDEYNESLKYIDAMSSKAGINTAYLNSAINGVLAMSLKAGLQAQPVRDALRKTKLTSFLSSPSKYNTSIDPSGAVRVTPKFNIAKQVANIAKEPGGELIEEYSQSVVSAFSLGMAEHSITKFIDNKYNGDSVAEIGDYMANSFSAGLTALTNSLTDKETIKSGVYGAISSALGTFGPVRRTTKVDSNGNIVYKRNKDGSVKLDSRGRPEVEKVLFGRGLNSQGQRESGMQALARIAPWRSGLYSQIKETIEEKRNLNLEAQSIEDWFNDPSNKDKFTTISGTLSWAKDMEQAGVTSDEFGFRNSTLGKTINDAVLLDKIKGTALYDSFMSELSRTANIELGTAEAKELVDNIRNDASISKDFESMSDDQIVNRIKDNSNKLLNTINEIQEESENLDRILGNIDDDTKISLIYGKLSLEDWNDRKSKLDSEIKDIAKNIENTVENSGLEDKKKRLISMFGTFKEADKQLNSRKKELESLEKDIKNLESRKGNIKSEKNILKDKKNRAKALRKEIADIEEKLKEYEEIKNSTLSESEILSLPAEVRSTILDPKNLDNYSEKQQEVIKNINNKGNSTNVDFSSKVKDLGKIENAIRSYMEQYNYILANPEFLSDYAQKQKELAGDILTKKKYNAISAITDYATFVSEMDKIYSEGSTREIKMIESALLKSGNVNFNKYVSQNKALGELIDQVEKDEYFKDMDQNDLLLYWETLRYLSNKGVDITDVNLCRQILLETDSEGNYVFQKHIEDIEDSSDFAFTSMGDVIQTYVDSVLRNNKDKEELERVERDIPINMEGVESTPAPPVSVNVLEENNEEDTLENPAENPAENTEDNKVKSFIQNIINNLKFNEEAKTKVRDIFSSSDIQYDNIDQITDFIKNEIGILSSAASSSYDFEAIELLNQVYNRVVNKFTSLSQSMPDSSTNTLNDIAKKVNADGMKSLDMSWIKREHPESPLLKYYERYKIDDFLKEGKLKRGDLIFFVSDPQLVEDVKKNMSDNELNYTLNNIPLVAVVESPLGELIIGDKHYQPIAIMPATENINYQGSARLGIIRKHAYKQSDSPNIELIKDDNGNIINTTLSDNVKADPPTHIQPSEPNKSVQTVQIDDLTVEDKEEIEQLSKKDRRNTPIYRSMKSRFLSRLVRTINKDGDTELDYVIPNLKGKEKTSLRVFVTPVHKTKDRNSDKTIEKLFLSADIGVLKANSRLSRTTKELKKFFEYTFELDDFVLNRDENGELIIPNEVSKQLENYSRTLEKNLSNYIRIPKKQGWKFNISVNNRGITYTDGTSYSKSYTLELINSNGEKIILSNEIVEGKITDYTIMTILSNLFMDIEHSTVRMRSSKDSFIIWNVPFKDVENSNEDRAALDNISDIYDDDILEVSKHSLEYTIKGVVIGSPFRLDGSTKYASDRPFNSRNKSTNINETENSIEEDIGTQNTNEVNNQTEPPIDTIKPGTVKVGVNTVDTDTGAIVEGDLSSVPKGEVQEQKPIRTIRDRRRKRPSTKQVNNERVIPNKFKWGVFEGSTMSVEEITGMLNAQEILTEEQWNSRSNEEMERVLQCCGAFK